MSDRSMGISRRLFCAGGLALPATAWALGDSSRVDVVEIVFESGTSSRPEAWSRLLVDLEMVTSVETVERVVQVQPGDPALFDHPFAVINGTGGLPRLDEATVQQLSRYLSYGGFLYIDDSSGAAKSAFDDSVRDLCARLFPTRPLFPLDKEHSVYRSFFMLEEAVGRTATHKTLEGVAVGQMTPIIYGRNDLGGALARGRDGRPLYACSPGGENQRREAVKLAINLVMYALTSDYKKDQAHVKALMEEGRL